MEYLAMLACIVGLIAWLRERIEERAERVRKCGEMVGGHDEKYVSAWNEGVYWSAHCRRCKRQRPVSARDVPREVRENLPR